MIKGLHSYLAMLTAQTLLSFQWRPAHVGMAGNTAHKLAKTGSKAQQTQNLVNYSEVQAFLHSRLKEIGRKHNADYQTHLDPNQRLDLAQQTIMQPVHKA